ncbi:hereditary hemochromatosis protein homolog [Dromiciops gliroides]|uniref:hereditary hemochromatosis protein homolog n=1 Tax=Dromiciops gliroides TaxID=33562 RepID=UPI001CC6D134|nr:hereditary hemochromatosis protein homolog [Dromiciops gliroides]
MLRRSNSHLYKMVNWWRRGDSVSSWILILMLFAFRETQAVHHRNELQFTKVFMNLSVSDFTVAGFIDDVQWLSYDKLNKQIIVKEVWISDALGTNFIEDMNRFMRRHEGGGYIVTYFLTGNDPNNKRNHTKQLFVGCELDDGIQLKSKARLGWDGEDMMETDDHTKHWVFLNPRAQKLKPVTESSFWTNEIELSSKKYCVGVVQNIFRNSSIKENLPPKVYVSRHDSPNGTITFSCLATGFYPRSILLIWKKTPEPAKWGKESSSGTLPNADDTFYLHVTLELLPGDSGEGYTCVVEHSELQKPAIYPVPGKPPRKWLWAIAVSILAVFILGLSCAKVFITWNKKNKTGTTSQSQLKGPISSPTIHLQ